VTQGTPCCEGAPQRQGEGAGSQHNTHWCRMLRFCGGQLKSPPRPAASMGNPSLGAEGPIAARINGGPAGGVLGLRSADVQPSDWMGNTAIIKKLPVAQLVTKRPGPEVCLRHSRPLLAREGPTAASWDEPSWPKGPSASQTCRQMGHHVRQCVLTARCCSLCVVRTIKPQRTVTVFCQQVMKHRRDRYELHKSRDASDFASEPDGSSQSAHCAVISKWRWGGGEPYCNEY
jgi:hypothetical protein